jgi:predicted NACHT family NTPase
MNDEPDINQIIVGFLNQNLDRFYSTAKDVMKGTADRVRLHVFKTYQTYLNCVAARYSKAKTFLVRAEAVSLYDFYVPCSLSIGGTLYRQPSFNQVTRRSRFIVITGGAGTGKSVLMRHLFLTALESQGKVPVFIELRELNKTSKSLMKFVQSTLKENHFTLDDDYIQKALQRGHFAFFLDGFDELSRKRRASCSKEIQTIGKQYDKNVIVVSSRPDYESFGWQDSSNFNIEPLTSDQACDLVTKTPFDEKLKSKFLKDLRSGLFHDHSSFLSNPLLLSIMLLTYGESAGIPNKLNIFYNQAYEALFQRHDALKGGFQRERISRLNIQDFASVFSAFAIQTYDKRVFQFTQSEALRYIDEAKRLTSLSFDSADYLADSIQAVCLLLEEGLSIVFAHRSFQEYFAARFICEQKPEVQSRLLTKYVEQIERDSVIELLYEMRPDVVERLLIIPALEMLDRHLRARRTVGITHFVRFLNLYYEDQKRLAVLRFALEKCGHLAGWPGLSKLPRPLGTLGTGRISATDDVVRQLAFGGSLISIRTLEILLQTKSALTTKQIKAEASIHEILGLK